MRKLLLLFLGLVVLSGHDMYLKLDSYFLKPNTKATIQLFNGTFDRSDNSIDRNRMRDASLIGNGQRIAIDTNQWSENNGATLLNLKTGEEGTWVAGVSTHPRTIEMSAADFNNYLEHDGLLDMLAWRKANNALEQDAVEKYSKHVKTIFQLGEKLSPDWQTFLGYPIEFIPLSNPYDLHPGHILQIELMWQGAPLPNQLVYVGADPQNHSHTHGDSTVHRHEDEGEEHQHDPIPHRTNAEGILNIPITHQGIWHLRTIHLSPSEELGLTHESNWASLSFGIGEGHEHPEAVVHQHEEHTSGIPSYFYWVGSLILFLGLFFWFNRKTS